MDHTLNETLAAIDKPTESWTSTDGSTALVLPYGGRILGLFAPGSDQNFLWTHPALSSPSSARTFYQSTDWHNSGGDRTWISPRLIFFCRTFPSSIPMCNPANLTLAPINLSAQTAV